MAQETQISSWGSTAGVTRTISRSPNGSNSTGLAISVIWLLSGFIVLIHLHIFSRPCGIIDKPCRVSILISSQSCTGNRRFFPDSVLAFIFVFSPGRKKFCCDQLIYTLLKFFNNLNYIFLAVRFREKAGEAVPDMNTLFPHQSKQQLCIRHFLLVFYFPE